MNPFMIISISLSFHLFKKGADYCSNNHLSVVYIELLIRIPNDIFDGDFLTITFMLYVRIVKVHPLNKKRSKKETLKAEFYIPEEGRNVLPNGVWLVCVLFDLQGRFVFCSLKFRKGVSNQILKGPDR